MKNKKMTRTCICCKDKKEKRELIRIVRNKEKGILVDLEQKIKGRGAYICKSEECFNKMVKGNRLKINLKTKVEEQKYEELRGVIFDKTKREALGNTGASGKITAK